MILILQACGGGSDSPPAVANISNTPFTLSGSIPSQFTDQLLEENELTAKISINGGTPTTLQVDSKNRTIQAVFSSLSPGLYDFSIQLFLNNISVAQIESKADFTTDTTVTLDSNNIRYLDSDADGFSNLAELLIFGPNSLAWNDASTHPDSEIPRHSAHYVLVDSFGTPFLAGPSQSPHYGLTTGFISKIGS